MPLQRDLLLGIDAGGTKTVAVLAGIGAGGVRCVLGTGRSGPANPTVGGVPSACEEIVDALRVAREEAALDGCSIRTAVLAVAGAADPVVRCAIADWAEEQGIAQQVLVVPDFAPVLAAAACPGPRVGVIAGTGSVALCVDSQGELHRSGGWGPLLGDEGSGYAIGRRVLRAVLRDYEAADATGLLTSLVLEAFSLNSPAEILAAVYKSEDPRKVIASLAKHVESSAATHAPARDILRSEVDGLAGCVSRGCEAASLRGVRPPLVLAGGVLTKSTLAQDLFLQALEQRELWFESVTVVREPAEVCLSIAEVDGKVGFRMPVDSRQAD